MYIESVGYIFILWSW